MPNMTSGRFVSTQVCEALRTTYRELPATTVAGLARATHVAFEDALQVLTGTDLGIPNLVQDRVDNADAIRARMAGMGRVRPEPALLKHRTPRPPKVTRYMREAARLAAHRAAQPPYVPIVGMSARRGRARASAQRQAAVATPPPPPEPTP